jgi:hypothetical protein
MATGFKSLSANKPALFVVLILLAALTFTTCQLLLTKTSADAYVYTSTTRSGYGTVYCPAGYRVSGGGYDMPSNSYGSTYSTEYTIKSSKPVSGQGWQARATKVSGSYSSYSGWRYYTSTQSINTYAVCMR